MKKGDSVRLRETINAEIDKVWEALTVKERMVEWFFENIPSFEPKTGFKTEFMIENEGRKFLHKWKVRNVNKPRLLEMDWNYDGYNGSSILRIELIDNSSSTVLTLEHLVTEDFEEDIHEFNYESCKGGWEYFISERLKNYLEGG